MLAKRCSPEPLAAMPHADLLGRVGAELGRLASSVDALQARLSPVMHDLVRDCDDLVPDLQHLDLLGQSLAALSALMAGLGTAAEGTAEVRRLIDAMPLRDVADRLSGIEAAGADEGFELF